MNKDVFNYLSEKAHDVTDYIRAKAEAVGSYLEDHATDIKDGFVKGTATVLTTAMLLGGMTGCDTLEQIGGPKLEQYEQLPIRPIDEIEQTGITAEDVLALYDDLAEKCVEAHYATTNWKDKLGDRFYDLDGSFVSITAAPYSWGTEKFIPEFYIPTTSADLGNRWTTTQGSEYYLENNSITGTNFYTTDLTLNFNLDKSSDTMSFRWPILKTDLDKVLEAFNSPTILLNEDLQNNVPPLLYYQITNNNLLNTNAYTAMTIDRNLINNATQDQLWTLYNMLNNMISLNFYGTFVENETFNTMD